MSGTERRWRRGDDGMSDERGRALESERQPCASSQLVGKQEVYTNMQRVSRNQQPQAGNEAATAAIFFLLCVGGTFLPTTKTYVF